MRIECRPDGVQSLDRSIVVEFRAGLAGRVDDRAGADDQVGHHRVAAPAQIRIEPALHRVDVIVGDELARLAVERRIVGEKDARLQVDLPGLAAVRDLRRPGSRHWREPGGRIQVVPVVEAFEDREGHALRGNRRCLLRIERVDIGRRDVQHLVRIGGARGARGSEREQHKRPPHSLRRASCQESSGGCGVLGAVAGLCISACGREKERARSIGPLL